jgi:hypothetical protein
MSSCHREVSPDGPTVGLPPYCLALLAAWWARGGVYAWGQWVHNPAPRIYGAPRVHQELRAAGLQVGRLDRKAKTRCGFSPYRTSGSKPVGVAESLL